jgi:prevent-host-death family protein
MDLKHDVIPVTELTAHTKEVLRRVNRTGEPTLITQNGRSAVLIVDVAAYQKQCNKLRLLEAIVRGERGILDGKGIVHGEVHKEAVHW